MSVATPTVLPRNPLFPDLMTRQPKQPYPTPKAPCGRYQGPMKRNFQLEMTQLDEEESELESLIQMRRNRGQDYMVPMGKLLTRSEETTETGEDDPDGDGSEVSGSDQSLGPGHSGAEEENDDSAVDLDADMEDMDEPMGDTTQETEDLDEGDSDDFEEEPSDV